MRDEVFAFRVNEDERQMISTVAQRLHRTQSDAMRLLVRAASAELETLDVAVEQPSEDDDD